ADGADRSESRVRVADASGCTESSEGGRDMQIRTRMCISIDGCVTTSDGVPVQLADPGFSPEAYGFVGFTAGTPDQVVVDGDPASLLERIRAANRGGDVPLVGGPRTIETFRTLGALDQPGLL